MLNFLWLRKIIRRHMKPIPQDNAEAWKKRLSLIYMLLAWNAFGIVTYSIFKGKADWAEYHGIKKEEGTPAQQWTKTLGIKKATVYRISGFEVSKYDINNEVDENGKIIEGNNSNSEQLTS